MDAILKALEPRGFEVDVTDPVVATPSSYNASTDQKQSATGVRISGQFVELGIEEKAVSAEAPQPPAGSYEYRPRYERLPTGQLTLRIRSRLYSGKRQTWSDGKRQRIEGCLDAFCAALLVTAEEQRLEAIAAEKRRQEELAARRRAEVAQRQNEALDLLAQDLDRRMADWRKAQDLREFIEALKDSASGEDEQKSSPSLEGWLRWANWRVEGLEENALANLFDRKHELTGHSELSSKFGWGSSLSTATLVAVVLNPYEETEEAREAPEEEGGA